MDFEQYAQAHPGSKFSDYYVHKLAEIVAAGEPHGALGKNLSHQKTPVDFEDAGRAEFERYVAWFGLTPQHRVVDFGCGSFRVGLHFIRFLDPGHYFGIDLTDDFIRPGLERLDERLAPGWRAEIGTVPARLGDAISHGAGFVFSSNVAYHVHPDECATYFERLDHLAQKPGARLCFDGRVAHETVRFGDRNWAHPFDFHAQSLPNFRLVRTIPAQDELPALLHAHDVVRVVFQLERTAPRDQGADRQIRGMKKPMP